jgi:AcrR family transcriptional regulator
MPGDTLTDRQQRILEVAARHFAEQPYEQVSTVAIAREAEVNRGWIYHEFGSKRELYRTVLRNSVQIPSLPPLSALVVDQAGLEAAVSQMVAGWLDDIETNREAYLMMYRVHVGSGHDPVVRGILREVHEETIDNALTTVLVDADEAPPEARAVVAAFGELAWQVLLEWLDSGRLDRRRAQLVLTESITALFRLIPQVVA